METFGDAVEVAILRRNHGCFSLQSALTAAPARVYMTAQVGEGEEETRAMVEIEEEIKDIKRDSKKDPFTRKDSDPTNRQKKTGMMGRLKNKLGEFVSKPL